MKKVYMAFTIIAITVAPTFLTSCASVSDDLVRVVTRQGSSLGDDVTRQASRNGDAAVSAVSRSVNQDELLKRCTQQARKSAVLEAWQRLDSSVSQQESENYLFTVAKDAIQTCTLGKLGDQLLDELASSVVSDFQQEYQLGRE
jgi:hypothetical protein